MCAVAEAVQHTYSPALNLGLARVLEGFDLSAEKIPDLDELFQRLPKGLKLRLFDAARTSGVTFTVASPAEQAALQKAKVEEMSEKDISKEIKRLEKEMMEFARNLEFEAAARTRDQLTLLKKRAFGGASPE